MDNVILCLNLSMEDELTDKQLCVHLLKLSRGVTSDSSAICWSVLQLGLVCDALTGQQFSICQKIIILHVVSQVVLKGPEDDGTMILRNPGNYWLIFSNTAVETSNSATFKWCEQFWKNIPPQSSEGLLKMEAKCFSKALMKNAHTIKCTNLCCLLNLHYCENLQ